MAPHSFRLAYSPICRHAGQLPTIRASCSSQVADVASPFDALPPAVHLSVLLAPCLPLVDRTRCALVSKRWRALLSEPAFWAEGLT